MNNEKLIAKYNNAISQCKLLMEFFTFMIGLFFIVYFQFKLQNSMLLTILIIIYLIVVLLVFIYSMSLHEKIKRLLE